jgi:hypothetical protein
VIEGVATNSFAGMGRKNVELPFQQSLFSACGMPKVARGIYKGYGDMKSWIPEKVCLFLHDELGLLDTTHVMLSRVNGRMLHDLATNPNARSALVKTLLCVMHVMKACYFDTYSCCCRAVSDFLHCKSCTCGKSVLQLKNLLILLLLLRKLQA